MRCLDFNRFISRRKLNILLCSVMFGLLIMLLFSGKSRVDIESIAVSPDEQYIACFETGKGHKILCFHADGSLAFDFNIPSDISAGGHCALWFEDDVLCVLFYRTEKITHFALDGTILDIVDNTAEIIPNEYPSFSRKGHKYIFDGNEIDVVYDKGSFIGYWFLDSKRYLAIIPQDEEMQIAYAWTATEGVTE